MSLDARASSKHVVRMRSISLRVAIAMTGVLACAPTYEDCYDVEEDCKAACADSFEGAECRLSCETELEDCLDEADVAGHRKEVAGEIFELLDALFGDDDD